VHHNIISGNDNVFSKAKNPGLLDKSVANRKLGITQLRDLGGPNSKNWNPDYT
jgi:hypothetical protein